MLRHLSARMDATSFRQHASYLGPHSASSFSRIATPFQGLRKNIPPMDEDALANLRAGESHLISPVRANERKWSSRRVRGAVEVNLEVKC